MCYESTQCTVVGQESSCTRYSHYKLYKIGLKTVQIKQEKEVLWIKAIFSSHIVIKYGNEGNLSSFILKISLEQDKMQICYNFVIPFSSLLLNEFHHSSMFLRNRDRRKKNKSMRHHSLVQEFKTSS
ncbi:uncharacterized protein LOC118179670 isoform X5 [Stegodyphus dumicola]|uniref:uncharacterized protein LOC118179670 isoform X5 n=1 Tax=Stegodyphus dumicola TaxID=202533 RepID=UPI0015AA1E5F|nr:uncharacterized protein LOC118179670 isoform X5 [Stegodyphus dumicola]